MRGTTLSVERNFTLAELLVLISIIVILAALLMPALRNALGAASTASCLNNQRQAGIGIQIFADNHNGLFFVDWAYQGGKLRFWHEGLLGQVTVKRQYSARLSATGERLDVRSA